MRLLDLTARARTDDDGRRNRIDLAWRNPDPVRAPGVRVVRREGTHPQSPEDGFAVAHGTGLTAAADTGLKAETVYYYTLFPFAGAPPVYDPDPHNSVAARTLAPYDFGGLLYGLLPALYRRYDAESGQLRRFLELPGAELDRIYSLTRTALALTDLDLVEGELLPLLAQWIGWRTDFGLPVAAQRNEIRFAPHVHATVGGVPTLDATVARVTGWANRTKEYVHNVARTNQPERLNLWSAVRDTGGTLSTPQLASVNFAHDGRPTAVTEADGGTLCFFHTRRRHGWDIWAKRFAAGTWQPSAPVVDRPGIDKHPSAARQGSRLWLFWQSLDTRAPAAEQFWRISFRTRTGETWSEPAVFGDPATERRMPAAVADNTGGLWLFWLEFTGGAWQVRYNRHNGTDWQLSTPRTLPLDGTRAPRVEDDLFALFHPGATAPKLWLLWARQEPGGPEGQTRFSIVHRAKTGLDPAAADWSPVRPLPKQDPAQHDRQPAALATSDGNLEVFYSSTRNGGWSVQRAKLTLATLTWSAAQQLVPGPYARRGPLGVDLGAAGTLLVFRTNESLPYTSAAYGATRTLDHRYAGSTTTHTTDTAKLALRGRFEDFSTYVYDTGTGGVRGNGDRVARDTVGLHLTPGTGDPAETAAAVSRLAGVLAEFMPVTVRPVFITP